MGERPIRLLLADDQVLFLSGLSALFSLCPDFQVCATARTGAEALERARVEQADVILLDIGLPDCSGVETARAIRRIGCQSAILIVSNYDSRADVVEAIAAGVQGYILKDAEAQALHDAVRAVAAGKRYVDPRLVIHMMEALADRSRTEAVPAPASPSPPRVRLNSYGLTERESDVLRLMASGLTNAEIARRLYIAPKTVRNYTTNVLQKLGVPDRTKAAVLALTTDLLIGPVGHEAG